jgi:uncharacterized membrane protein YdjX (TVP38/TMEM64 family)
VQAAILIVGIVIIVEAVINYEKIMPRLQAYLAWASGQARSWKGPIVFYLLYLGGIMLIIPNSVLAIGLGYTLHSAYDATWSK